MMMRIVVSEETVKFVANPRKSRGSGWNEYDWRNIADITGDHIVVAAALRALADRLDPQKVKNGS